MQNDKTKAQYGQFDFASVFFGVPQCDCVGSESDSETRLEPISSLGVSVPIRENRESLASVYCIPHALFIFCPHLGQNYHTWHRGIEVEHILKGI